MNQTLFVTTAFLLLTSLLSSPAFSSQRRQEPFHLPSGDIRWEFPKEKDLAKIGDQLQDWGTKKWEGGYERLSSQSKEHPNRLQIYIEWASRLVVNAWLQEKAGGGCRKETLKEAEQSARELSRIVPTFYWNDLLASLLHALNGRHREAKESIEEALKKAPDSSLVSWAYGEILANQASDVKGKDGPLVWSLKTRLFLKEGRPDQAEAVLKKWMKKQADNSGAAYLKEQVTRAISRSNQDYPTAIQTLLEAIRREPVPEKRVSFLLELSDLYREANDPDHAEASLKSAFDLKPANPQVLYALGRFYLQSRHDNQKAIYYFRAYLARTPPTEETGRLTSLVDQLEAERAQATTME